MEIVFQVLTQIYSFLIQELRLEDYVANRKGPQSGASAGGLFGPTQTQTQTQASGFGGFTQQKPAAFGG